MDTNQLIIMALISAPEIAVVLILLIMKEWRFRVLGTSYYKIHVMEKGNILDTILVPISNQLVYLDFKQKVAWIIPDKDNLIQQRKSFMFFADKRSCCALHINDIDRQKILDEVKKAKNMDTLLAKLPLIHRFYLQRAKRIDSIFGYDVKDDNGQLMHVSGQKGFAAKVKLNPEFMIDAVTFFHISTQLITDKIIKNATSIWDVLERNLPIIIVGIIIVAGLVIYSSRG